MCQVEILYAIKTSVSNDGNKPVITTNGQNITFNAINEINKQLIYTEK